MVQQIEVFRMGTSWCIQVDDRQALISASSENEAKETAEQLTSWQPDGPLDPFINITWQKVGENRYRMLLSEG